MWDIVRELVGGGVTVFLTTQYLEEADRLASRIALLDGGRVVAQGTPAELKRLVPGGSVRLEFGSRGGPGSGRRGPGRRVPRRAGLALEVPGDGGGARRCGRCSTASTPRRSRWTALSVRPADLDDVFLSLTGRRDGEEVPSHDHRRRSPTP